MFIDKLNDAHEILADLLEDANQVVVFTGAGISTECGVPDFRSKDSPWMRFSPIDYSAFISSESMREEAWRRKFALDDLYAQAAPGRGHHATANMIASGKATAIITQNIDNLHQASGVPEDAIIELHGNGSCARCLSCGERYEIAAIRRDFEASGHAPVCAACGGLVKSATISFGQPMPTGAMARAFRSTVECDLFLAIGSSLVVFPAASFPLLAHERGASLIIINGEGTPLDEDADLVLRGDIGDMLQPFAS